jgi:hypothetical protein
MTPWLLAFVSCIYLWTAFTYMPDRPGMALAFIAYAVSNWGFVIDAIRS